MMRSKIGPRGGARPASGRARTRAGGPRMPIKTVDDFVKQKVAPERQPLVEMLRALMREWAPKATEEISYGMLVWRGRLIFAWIIPTKKDITFGFMLGEAL